MKMKTKRRKKLLINNKKHIGGKQNTFLQFKILTYHRNRYIRSYHKNYTFIKRRINNLYVENHELNRIEL